MNETTPENTINKENEKEQEVKWDYTSSRQNLITGGLVVGGNLLLVVTYLLYRYIPAVHQFISGKPM